MIFQGYTRRRTFVDMNCSVNLSQLLSFSNLNLTLSTLACQAERLDMLFYLIFINVECLSIFDDYVVAHNPEGMNFFEAKEFCSSYGSYLSYPRNDDDRLKIREIMNDGRWDGWIGVNDIDEENVWRNVKGENVDYLPWSAGQPGNF